MRIVLMIALLASNFVFASQSQSGIAKIQSILDKRQFHHVAIDTEGGDIGSPLEPGYIIVHEDAATDPFCFSPVDFVLPDMCNTSEELMDSYIYGAPACQTLISHQWKMHNCNDVCSDLGYYFGHCYEDYVWIPEVSDYKHLGRCVCT